jgi:hypothetical protein
MTVAVQALPITYNGNGTAAPLAVPFRFLAADHLVITRIAADGTRTILTRGTHYSVAGGGDAQSGTVTPLAAIAVGDKWEINRVTPREQPTAYPVGDDFPAATHERALDRAMLVAQEQDRVAAAIALRTPLAPVGEVAPELDIAGIQDGELIVYSGGKLTRLVKAVFAGKFFGGDAAGNVVPLSGTGADASLRADLATVLGARLVGLFAGGSVEDAIGYVTPEMFGAVGDGITNDRNALQAAINDGRPIHWPKKTYRITSAIAQTATADVEWKGDGAVIVYDGPHIEAAVSITTSAKINIAISGVTFDGAKLCNIPLKISSTGAMANACNLTFNDVYSKRAKKNATFGSALGVYVLGSFDVVQFNGGMVFDCEMPTGSGTPSVSGIAGINVAPISTDKWCRRLIVNGTKVEKIYSSDLTYTADQDGIGYFVPNDASDAGKVESLLVVTGGASFKNCYGRSIKTQCRDTIVGDASFQRTEGYNGGVGDTEIDAQTGTLFSNKTVHDYRNGFSPNAVWRCLGGAAYGPNGINVREATVHLDSATTLERAVQTFPNDGFTSSAMVDGLRIFGKVKEPIALICNGPDNYAKVTNCFFTQIVNGATGEKALVYVRAGGVGSPDALIEIDGNVYTGGDAAAVARTQIAGGEMTATVSCGVNPGFANNLIGAISPAGLHTKRALALNGWTGTSKSAVKFSERFTELTVAAGATATFSVRKSSGAARVTILEGSAGNGVNYAEFWSTNSLNDAVKTGPNFNIGDTADPGSGVFRVWSSAANEVSIKNTDGGDYTFSIRIMERG